MSGQSKPTRAALARKLRKHHDKLREARRDESRAHHEEVG
jgi:hypothetical protein